MDKYGIYAQGDEWENAKNEALSANPETIEEAQEIVIKTGKVAGGKHTFLITADGIKENNNAEWEMPTVEIMEDGIAFIKLPHFMGNHEDGVKYANTVLNAIPDDLQGVVIDLRGNLGGNMHPMIAAVHRFLPDDIILKFQTRNHCSKVNVEFVVKAVGVTRQSPIECPVAILTDDKTASSGEAVLICFRGMENARTFGAPTAGYASCNQPFSLPDGSQLVLTTGTDVARTDEVFCDDPIQPDVMTETPVESALEWIKDFNKINAAGHYYYQHGWNYDIAEGHVDVHETGTMDFYPDGSALDSANQVYKVTLNEGGTVTWIFNYVSPGWWRIEGKDFYSSGDADSFRMELLEAKGDGCGEERDLAARIVKKVSAGIGRETKFNLAKLTKDELVWSYTYKDGHTDTWEFYRENNLK